MTDYAAKASQPDRKGISVSGTDMKKTASLTAGTRSMAHPTRANDQHQKRGISRVIGIGLFAALCLVVVAFGVLYASVNDFLFFHAAALPESARDNVKPLYLALMKLIGGFSVSLGLLGLYVTFGPVRRGSIFTAGVLSLSIAAPVLMAAYVAEMLAKQTGAPTSWHIMGVLVALDVLALGLYLWGQRTMRVETSVNDSGIAL